MALNYLPIQGKVVNFLRYLNGYVLWQSWRGAITEAPPRVPALIKQCYFRPAFKRVISAKCYRQHIYRRQYLVHLRVRAVGTRYAAHTRTSNTSECLVLHKMGCPSLRGLVGAFALPCQSGSGLHRGTRPLGEKKKKKETAWKTSPHTLPLLFDISPSGLGLLVLVCFFAGRRSHPAANP
jgi:hypothetical protein